MKKKNIRAGIVGAGFSARFHWEAVSRVHGVDVDVRGVYALDRAQAEDYARQRGITAWRCACVVGLTRPVSTKVQRGRPGRRTRCWQLAGHAARRPR